MNMDLAVTGYKVSSAWTPRSGLETKVQAQILLLLSWLISTLVAFIGCIFCLCLKGKARDIAINVVLVLGTVSAAICLSATLLPHEKPSDPAYAGIISPQVASDLYSHSLYTSSFLERLPSPWKGMFTFLGAEKKRDGFAAINVHLDKLLVSDPDNENILARKALVMHELNMNGAEFLQKRRNEMKQEKSKAKYFVLGAFEDLLQNKTKSSPSEDYDSVAYMLPDGWYRDTALKIFHENNPPKLAELQKSIDEKYRTFETKVQIYVSAIVVIALLGVGFLIYFGKRWQLSAEWPTPPSFRAAYGTVLAFFLTQQIAGLLLFLMLAFCSGFVSGATGRKVKVDEYGLVILVVGTLIGAVLVLLCAYFFYCRPNKLKFTREFFGRGVLGSSTEVLLYGIGGYFCAAFLESVAGILGNLITGKPYSGGTTLDMQMLGIVADGNLIAIALTWFAAAVLVPITEEIVFRGLIYRWLRSKIPMPMAMLLAGTFFGAAHLNLEGVWYLALFGVVQCAIYERTRSLPTVMLIHCCFNSWVLFCVYLSLV